MGKKPAYTNALRIFTVNVFLLQTFYSLFHLFLQRSSEYFNYYCKWLWLNTAAIIPINPDDNRFNYSTCHCDKRLLFSDFSVNDWVGYLRMWHYIFCYHHYTSFHGKRILVSMLIQGRHPNTDMEILLKNKWLSVICVSGYESKRQAHSTTKQINWFLMVWGFRIPEMNGYLNDCCCDRLAVIE